MVLGTLMMILVSWIFRRSTPRRVDSWSRRLQLISASAYALGHGGNDAQKTIGIIWMLLISAGITKTNEHVPYWVVVACYSAIGLGTIFGGWRIIKLMGQKITKLRPVGGFCARRPAALRRCFLPLHWGFPCRQRTRLPARSLASARPNDSPQCAGELREPSFGPGF
jgi:PiT family inorganic phosphate transporter